jgi:chromosomal replication initiation ATPase DnaA
LQPRPPISDILQAVAKHFGYENDEPPWSAGSRSDDAARAAAAYLARVRFGYSATSVAKALNYRDSSGVSHAVRRIRNSRKKIRNTIQEIEEQLK